MTTAMEPDDLYGLPLDAFIPERGALVKALRADKRRDEAAAVAALRKPSVAAWAVNQLVRSQPGAIGELFDAGDELRDAQARLLDGSGDGRALRAAGERERTAVDELVQAARGLLSTEGHELSPAVVERVADTLHAAALNEDAREQVREGRLERELRHIGLGLGEEADPFAVAPPARAKPRATPAAGRRAGPPPAPPAKRQAKAAPKPAATSAEERRAAREQAKRDREEREGLERERAQARKAARVEEAAAKRRAERAGHALKVAEERRERAAQALAGADAALEAAQAEARDALRAQKEAQAKLDAL
jgi:hypothetical protein